MILIDQRSRVPIYEQIQENFEMLVLTGALKRDEQLPGVRTLAKELAINPNTIAKAYQLMEVAGIIYSLPGRGSFIALTADELRRRHRPQALQKFREVTFHLKEVGVAETEAQAEVSRIYASPSEGRDKNDSRSESDEKI
ncbi:MAG: GntR family transcriptional regulator [Clostridiales bacterium]|nr:GntR family transcriptional regulator [Clostridiales bacterium]MDU7243927.1 GntR family transcriptional regulator [Clostridiales bacterium]MDU7505592.1 GntR family transcriptional regulator [Clostridia bacterium]